VGVRSNKTRGQNSADVGSCYSCSPVVIHGGNQIEAQILRCPPSWPWPGWWFCLSQAAPLHGDVVASVAPSIELLSDGKPRPTSASVLAVI